MASLEEVLFKDFYETYVQGVTCPDKLNLFETDRYMCDEYLSDDDSDKSENIRVNKFFPDCGCCCFYTLVDFISRRENFNLGSFSTS